MEQLTTILTKSQVIKLFETTKEQIMAGEAEPLKIAIQLKALEDVIKKLRTDPDVQELMLDEALKEGVKTFKVYGAEIHVKETGVKYDYMICNDATLGDLYGQLEVLKKKIKDRETMLKTISKDSPAVSMDGEILNPPLKTSKTGISINLK